jgi:hypothetical protein
MGVAVRGFLGQHRSFGAANIIRKRFGGSISIISDYAIRTVLPRRWVFRLDRALPDPGRGAVAPVSGV